MKLKYLKHLGFAAFMIMAACNGNGGTQGNILTLSTLNPELAVYEPSSTVIAVSDGDCTGCAVLIDGIEAPIFDFTFSVPEPTAIKAAKTITNPKYPVFQIPSQPCPESLEANCKIEISLLQNDTESNPIVIAVRNPAVDPNVNCPEGLVAGPADGCVTPCELHCDADSDCIKECLVKLLPLEVCNEKDVCVDGFSCQNEQCMKADETPQTNGQYCFANPNCQSNNCVLVKLGEGASAHTADYGICTAKQRGVYGWETDVTTKATSAAKISKCKGTFVSYEAEAEKACNLYPDIHAQPDRSVSNSMVNTAPSNADPICLNYFREKWDAAINNANLCWTIKLK